MSGKKERLRKAELRFQKERDRRYAEVNDERQKALKIKESADLAALELARQIQTYKDEKANELREQINNERGLYLTRDEYIREHKTLEEKMETAVKPLAEYVTGQLGRRDGIGMSAGVLVGALTVASLVVGIVVVVANLLTK